MHLPPPGRRLATLLLVIAPFLSGCDQVVEVLELPNPAKDAMRADAENRAIGGACRHAGRSLEDCYALNKGAVKASVFAGWRDMNDYMMEHGLQTVPSHIEPSAPPSSVATPGADQNAPEPVPAGSVPPMHSPLAGR